MLNGAKLFLNKEEFSEWEQSLSQPQILDSNTSHKQKMALWFGEPQDTVNQP